MFDTTKTIVSAYAHLVSEVAKDAATATGEFASDHKSEVYTAIGTAFVVGLTTRATGFKAGYAFAKSTNAPTA